MRLRHVVLALSEPLTIATWNVNGIAARGDALAQWLRERSPDIACLQEVKCVDERFPAAGLREEGWHVLVHGEKSFNGVALLSRRPVAERGRRMGESGQARWLEVEFGEWIVASLYLPNGNPAPGPKYELKLAWMEALAVHAASLLATERPVVLAGDFNVCPTDLDVARPEAMADDALCLPDTRAAWRRLLVQGWTDALRALHPAERLWTFWDYQNRAFDRDWGLRIDHLLLSPAAADRLLALGVDREMRAGPRPSDHVPVWGRFEA